MPMPDKLPVPDKLDVSEPSSQATATHLPSAPPLAPSTKSKVCRAILWVLIVLAWLLYLVPGFMYKDAQDSEALNVQGHLQVTLAGKLMRVQDAGIMPPQLMEQVNIQDFLAKLAQECDHHPYLTICQALERLHRGDSRQALKLLERHPVADKKWDPLYNATLEVARSRCANRPPQPGNLESAMLLQESVQSELSDYFRTIARRQLAVPALWSPSLDILTSDDTAAARRDVICLSSMMAVALANTLLVLIFAVWWVARRFRPSRFRGSTGTRVPLWCGDPLRVCGAYVLMQWAMMISVLCLSLVFAFKSSRVLSVFSTYLCAYTLLTLAIAWLLPRLERRTCASELQERTCALETQARTCVSESQAVLVEDASASSVAPQSLPVASQSLPVASQSLPAASKSLPAASKSLSIAQRLQWHRPRWRDVRWGWLGFALTMASGSLISQIIECISGKAPYSVNPLLDVVSNSHPSEWVLLLLELAVLGPMFEEILFRGLLFGGLRGSWGPWLAALVSAAVFGLTHIDPQGTFVLMGMGLCFAYVYHKSGSLWSSIIAHGLWNCFVTCSVLYMS